MRRLLLALLLAATPSAAGAFSYDEGIDGDLSGDRLAPTALLAALGSNTLSATSVAGDLEYVHLSLPSGTSLASLVLTSFSSTDDVAFIAVQAGSAFSVPPASATPGDLLGYAHFGSGSLAGGATVGNDMLDDLGAAADAIGFVPPLTGSDYTFWIQQTGPQPFGYTLDFQVVPEPRTGALVVMGLIALAARRRQRNAPRP